MAERRMFTEKITDSDAFLDMPSSSQCLYFQLNMKADDDGFVNNPKKIVRSIKVSEDDLKLLIMKRFIIVFESGVIVIKHWRMHNYIRKDRYSATVYQEELAMLDIKDNGSYTIKNDDVNQMTTNCQPNDNQWLPQVRLGKVRLGKVIKTSVGKNFVPPTVSDVSVYCTERKNKVDAETFVDFYTSKNWYVGKSKMKDWKACIRTWEKGNKNTSGKRNDREDVLPTFYTEQPTTIADTDVEKEKMKERLKALGK